MVVGTKRAVSAWGQPGQWEFSQHDSREEAGAEVCIKESRVSQGRGDTGHQEAQELQKILDLTAGK